MIKRTQEHFSLGRFNHVVRGLIISDVAVLSAFGLIAPIFAVFVTETIPGATIQTAGIATTIYLLARSMGQVPIAMIVDRMRGERDDFSAMIIGTICLSVVPLLYLFVTTPHHLYIVQFLYGLSAAIVFPAWMATFTRHIDPMHEGLEWGAYRSVVDVGTAFAAGVGGYIAITYGFHVIFFCVSGVALLGCLHLMSLRRHVITTRVNL